MNDDIILKAKEKALEEIESILSNANTTENLVHEYARASNMLKVETERENDFNYRYAMELEELLKSVLIGRILAEYGYHISDDVIPQWIL